MIQSPRPIHIKAPHGARTFEITWADGVRHSIPHEVLRGYCPCATCQGHGAAIRYVTPPNLDLRELERVGNYALGLTWGDGHSSGIYSFAYLQRLGTLCTELGPSQLVDLGQLPP